MATIDQIIQQSLNPFDNFAAGNFWEEQEPAPTVESIHKEALTIIENDVDKIAQDHQTRTVILYGDSGAGKTYFLGRLKEKLNDRAFFAYIEPFPQSDHIWRHILRYTVDSLVKAPAGQTDSQLILWLRSCLSKIQEGLQNEQRSFLDRIKGVFGKRKTEYSGDRQSFIDILKKTIGTTGIYNANEFFGVLYDLTDPDLYSLSCEWLKGDDLDEENLKKIRVKQSIDNEEKARGILGNFSKISAKTQPIVLCFDQLDSIARLPDGGIDLQALFNVNSAIYNGKWKSLLIVISIRTSTWNNNHKRVQPSDLDRVTQRVGLKRIGLEQAEALLATRLYPLHRQANPQPESAIYPLNQKVLLKAFPSTKASARHVLTLGQQLFLDYKQWVIKGKQPPKPQWLEGDAPPPPPPPPPCTFPLIWQKEFQKIQQKVNHLRYFSSPELMQMLKEVLSALQIQEVKQRFLPSPTYAAYSLSYQLKLQEKVGLVWTEDSNMASFCNLLKSCHKVIKDKKNTCETLYLIRAEGIGKEGTVGYKLYKEIFTVPPNHHIKPDLTSLHYLATYHKLVNDACAGELVVGNATPNLKELEALIRKCNILNNCKLLQDLGIFPKKPPIKPLEKVKENLFNVVKNQLYMPKQTLIKNTVNLFSEIDESDVEKLVEQLCKENKLQIYNAQGKPEEQYVCIIPES